MKKLFLVDAYALIYRSYYAFLNRPMRNAEGMNTSAIFGFVKFLREMIRREQPHYLGVAFDSKGTTFRHEMYPEYKANRQQTPEDIHAAVPWIKDILRAMHIPILEMCGWEADDIIGTMSRHACDNGFEVYMVTPDKDFGQLVNNCARIYRQRTGGEGIEIIGPHEICEKYGIGDPRLFVDILALWGDASDNIPGVPGVGEKTAARLVAEYGTVEDMLARAGELKGKVGENILANREQLLLSKKLAAIDLDAPVPFEPDKLIIEEPDHDALREIYAKLGFTMFMNQPAGTPPNQTHTRVQPSLFDSPGGQQDLFAAAENGYATAETTPHEYIMVRGAGEVEALAAELSKVKEFCFDTETTGFDPLTSQLVGVSVAVEPHKAWYIPWHEEYAPLLKPLFENPQIAKIGQNLKFDIMVMAQAGIEVRGRLLDTMLLHYLADPEARHGMNHLARAYLNYSPIEIETLIGRGAHQLTMDTVAPERVAEYAAEDADITLQLRHKFAPDKLYDEIEEPLIRVLADMETVGVRIDTSILAESGRELTVQAAALEERIRTLAGDPTLNVNSSLQLGEALFGRMKIDPKPRLTKTRKYRTDEEYLASLAAANPIIGDILEYRGLRKLLSTYIDALPQLVNPRDGRIHTSFNQAVTATGRLSSSNPNLQNIPIRTAQGREIRRAFIPADSDHLILSADYSQVELRLMAHLSGDENLLGAFRRGEDIHTDTASRVFGVPPDQVTSDQRRKAKTANFGIIYGISAFGLSERLGIPRGEAREIIDGYFRSYPGVRAYMDRVVEQAHADGYVSTIFGRRRMLPDIHSGNATVRALAERNAINAPIQGSAADIMKLAMIHTWNELRQRGLRSRMILQVHDELVIDLYKPEHQEVAALVVDAMEHAATLSIPLTVEYGTGENWLEAH
jgi:DNA polymerase-1